MKKRDKTKEKLLKAALHVLSRNASASFCDIANEAGVGRATLYRYFPDKEHLLNELAWKSLRETENIFLKTFSEECSPEDKLMHFLEGIVPLADHFHFLTQEYYTMGDIKLYDAYRHYLESLTRVLDSFKAQGLFAIDVPTVWIASSLDSLLYTAGELIHEGHLARKEAPRLILRTLLKGLSSPDLPDL